ncbi:MAG: lysophospholipid acyltransferase family protein [Bacteroidales bacterium]|nr:lysophospholipid acyltransferase family protein [Bacteroidales bacterium]MBQ6100948.1 lysophospholipid acyltransferase family protein [Bacteroidales bacterium]
MRQVVTKSDVKQALGMKGFFGNCAAGLVYGVCGLGEINRLFDEAADYQGPEFADHLLENMNITIDVAPEQLENIPKEGGFIVVSNHPFGGIEGVMLLSVVAKRRPDFKLMANFILSHIPNLKDCFFSVNPFEKNPEWKSSVGGVKGAIQHVAAGKGLGIFPAGEVSRYHGHDYPEDLPWSNSIARIIKNANVPVIPVFWDGQNSARFYRWDKINSMLGTARLTRELANKRDQRVILQIGRPILPAEVEAYEKPAELAAYLRSRSYALEANINNAQPKTTNDKWAPVEPARDTQLLIQELETIREKSFLFSTANFECFLANYDDIPNLMHELGRLREEAFRYIGEGTGKSLDTDEYDHHYKHLILWDSKKQQVVGAYRLGFGNEIMRDKGIKGFYVSSLFKFDESFGETLKKTIELGRSFVTVEYQREVLPLMLLLRGLAGVVTRNPEMEHFIGPVSISSWYPKFFQSMIVKYVTEKHPVNAELAQVASPTTPFHPDFLKVDPDVLLRDYMDSVDKFDKFMFRLSNSIYRMPTLFKKYLKLNAKFLCFNVDPDFNDTLDALLFLTFTDFPEDEVMPLFRDATSEEQQLVRERFGYE